MKRLLIGGAILSIFCVGCATAPDDEAPPEAAAPAHPDQRTRCGSPESDLFGCTSAECCARTGIDCGDPHCTCRPLIVAPQNGEQR